MFVIDNPDPLLILSCVMKKVFLFFVLLLLALPDISARNIPAEQARQMADAFWQSAAVTRAASPQWRLVLDDASIDTRAAGDAPAWYVFDNESGPGFVVVAGDDVAMPVLGYSFDNEFPQGTLPPNLREWLDAMHGEIARARTAGARASADVAEAWSATRAGSTVVKLETALWDQSAPYNRLCPMYQGYYTYTGCTATALAIAMRYHRWPQRGSGTLPAYVTTTYGISVPEQQLGYDYDWDNMPLQYPYNAYSQQQATAVATLMRDCGIMLQSDYGPENISAGTGAYAGVIPEVLVTYMDYDRQVRSVDRAGYNTADWNTMMQSELDAQRPIIYTGFNDQAGHAFILDGYTDDCYYSVNWGWSGYCNGYFLLTALDPSGQGIGGSDHYNYGQTAIIGMRPDEGGVGIEEMRFIPYVDTDGTEYTGLSVSTPVVSGEPFRLYVGFLYNAGSLTFTGECKLSVADANGNIVEDLSIFGVDVDPGWGYMFYDDLTVNSTIMPGYRIRAYYRSENMTDWQIVKGNDEEGCVWDLLIADESTIEETTRMSYDKKDRILRFEVKDGVSATLSSPDGADMNDKCSVAGNGISIDTTSLPAGTYLLVLQKGNDRKELRFTVAGTDGE